MVTTDVKWNTRWLTSCIFRAIIIGDAAYHRYSRCCTASIYTPAAPLLTLRPKRAPRRQLRVFGVIIVVMMATVPR